MTKRARSSSWKKGGYRPWFRDPAIIELPQLSEERRSIFFLFSSFEKKVIFCHFCEDEAAILVLFSPPRSLLLSRSLRKPEENEGEGPTAILQPYSNAIDFSALIAGNPLLTSSDYCADDY